MTKTIYLQKIGDIKPEILRILKKNLKLFFKKYNIKGVILPDPLPILDSEYDPENRNYNARKIRKRLIIHGKNKNYYRILGVTNIDIFTKHTRHLYGVAYPPNIESTGGALVSVIRLKEEFYGRTENRAQFEQRIFKVAIHELSHTFGLEHCENLCVMCSSQSPIPSKSLEDTDKKPSDFCETCLQKLKNFLSDSA